MANNPKGLGKGLAALLGDDVIDSQEEKSSLFCRFLRWKAAHPSPASNLIRSPWRT